MGHLSTLRGAPQQILSHLNGNEPEAFPLDELIRLKLVVIMIAQYINPDAVCIS